MKLARSKNKNTKSMFKTQQDTIPAKKSHTSPNPTQKGCHAHLTLNYNYPAKKRSHLFTSIQTNLKKLYCCS